MIKSGNEWRWKRHNSVTFKGNRWYRHSEQVGSHAIDFMQEFYGMTFQEAMTYLLNGEAGQQVSGEKQETTRQKTDTGKKEQPAAEETTDGSGVNEQERKPLVLPEKNENMKRVYAYLMQKRFISRDILSYFSKQGTLYESREHHNAVFVGTDKDGVARHAHKKGTCSEGDSFRINEEGSDPAYGFGYSGQGKKLYVFEAPIDFLSFLTLYPKDWQENCYIVLNGVAEHAMLRTLQEHAQLDTVVLCLDHDPAGIENCYRLTEIVRNAFPKIKVNILRSANKDWNEDLKAQNGAEPMPAQEHPKMMECRAWCETLKQVAESIDMKYATVESLQRYHYGIAEKLKRGTKKEQLEDAFDGDGMFLASVAVKIMEQCGRELGKETSAAQIIDNLCRRYRPDQDKGNLKTKLSGLQSAYDAVISNFPKERDKAQNEILVKKCMGLTMECIKAHIFVFGKIQCQTMEGGMKRVCSQS